MLFSSSPLGRWAVKVMMPLRYGGFPCVGMGVFAEEIEKSKNGTEEVWGSHPRLSGAHGAYAAFVSLTK